MPAVRVAAVLLALAALHFARPVMLPFVIGLMIAALAWPMDHWLQERIPRATALLATILIVSVVLVALLGAIGWSAASIARDLQERPERVRSLHRRASEAAGRFGLSLPEFGVGANGGNPAGPTDADTSGAAGTSGGTPGDGGFARRLGIGVYSTVGYLGLAVGFAALILAELRRTRDRVRLRFEAGQATRLLAICGELARSMRRYVGVKSITSGIAGVATGLLSLIFGIEFAAVWALLAFLFEYVPAIGSILAVVPPVTYAFLQFDDFTRPLVALAVFTVVQLFLGNYVDPRIEGRLLSLSPVVVLLSIIFWAWLWGAPGSLLGVPIVVAVTIVTRHFASTRWVWALLTEPNDDEEGEQRPHSSEAGASRERR